MDIYVGNLNIALEEDSLRKLFEVFGPVSSVILIKNNPTGNSKSFGFVNMPNAIDAERAIAELHDIEVAGRRLVVYEAKQMPKNNEFRPKQADDDDKGISFKIPKEEIPNQVKYSKTVSNDGSVKIKFNP